MASHLHCAIASQPEHCTCQPRLLLEVPKVEDSPDVPFLFIPFSCTISWVFVCVILFPTKSLLHRNIFMWYESPSFAPKELLRHQWFYQIIICLSTAFTFLRSCLIDLSFCHGFLGLLHDGLALQSFGGIGFWQRYVRSILDFGFSISSWCSCRHIFFQPASWCIHKNSVWMILLSMVVVWMPLFFTGLFNILFIGNWHKSLFCICMELLIWLWYSKQSLDLVWSRFSLWGDNLLMWSIDLWTWWQGTRNWMGMGDAKVRNDHSLSL